jgi:chromosome segregation ATPase
VSELTRLPYLGYFVRWLAAIARAPRIAVHAQGLQAQVDVLAIRLAEDKSRLADLVAQTDGLRLNLREEIWRRDQQRARDLATLRELKDKVGSVSQPSENRLSAQFKELEALISAKLDEHSTARSADDETIQALEANVSNLSANVADLREQVDRRLSRLRKDLRLEENTIQSIMSPDTPTSPTNLS